MAQVAIAPIRQIEPLAEGWRTSRWNAGQFDTAGRTFTPEVEGIIRTADHVLMVTLSGSAQCVEVSTDCNHRYIGCDNAGAVSFVPAGCTRHLKMRGVQSQWASISLNPALFCADETQRPYPLAAFSNCKDDFVAAALAALADQMERCGDIEPLYGEALGLALARHLVAKHGGLVQPNAVRAIRLPRWKLARVTDYIEANIEQGMQIADLARIVGLSPGYFHRAFKATTGCTPLAFIQRRRIDRAALLIATTNLSLAAVAIRTGFPGPSHFARTFRQIAGCNPSAYRLR